MVADEKIRILFVSDERMRRDGLLSLFSRQTDMNIIGASDAVEGLKEPMGQSEPDVTVVSMARTPGGNVASVRQLLRRWPRTKVVVLSPFSKQAFVAEVLRAGAHGYVGMECTFEELLEAVRMVRSGARYLCSTVRRLVLDRFARGGADKVDPDDVAMTDREDTILQLFGDGRSSKEIAALLNLSSKTIDACRRQLMKKLDVDSTAGLVKCAIVLGLTTADPWPA
jgi:DNA-binding NarL/FixJ family response regulator